MPPTLSMIRFSPSICRALNKCFLQFGVDTSICWGKCGGRRNVLLCYLCFQSQCKRHRLFFSCRWNAIFSQQYFSFTRFSFFLFLCSVHSLPESHFSQMIHVHSFSSFTHSPKGILCFMLVFCCVDDGKNKIIISISSVRAFYILSWLFFFLPAPASS